MHKTSFVEQCTTLHTRKRPLKQWHALDRQIGINVSCHNINDKNRVRQQEPKVREAAFN